MPRRNGPARRRGAARPPQPQPAGGHEHVEAGPGGGEWVVRRVAGSGAGRTYRCPGCQQQLAATQAHVVAWPQDGSTLSGGGVDERRHWHAACWRARERRPPR